MRENRHYSENNHSIPSDLIQKEQEYRHQWQDKFLKTHNTTFRMGQVFGLIYHSALLYLIYDLIQSGDKKLALQLFIANIALIAFAILVTAIERRVTTRKPPRRSSHNNRRYNNKGRGNHHRHDQNRRRDRD